MLPLLAPLRSKLNRKVKCTSACCCPLSQGVGQKIFFHRKKWKVFLIKNKLFEFENSVMEFKLSQRTAVSCNAVSALIEADK